MQKQSTNTDSDRLIDTGTSHSRIAVVSDTHGLLRDSVFAQLDGVSHILHAGDVGDPTILDRLRTFAPTTAIRGNIDTTGVCGQLPATELVQLGPVTAYLVHSLADLDIEPTAAGVNLIVSGHSHKPTLEERRGVTYLNPGSIGPRRFKLPISMALLHLSGSLPDSRFHVEFVTLDA